MVEAAISKGMDTIGFSAHSYTFFDESYCLKKENIGVYKETIRSLGEEYAGKIRVLCGIEQDFYAAVPTEGYDYVIGSVHYLLEDGVYYPIDNTAEAFIKMVEEGYGGDIYRAISAYYKTVAQIGEKLSPTFIGHFDLISKFNETHGFFNPEDARYQKAWQEAMDKLLPQNIPFEVNTGAISRGYKTFPYPDRAQLSYLRDRGGKVLLSGDVHAAENLCFGFDRWEGILREMGVPLVTL